MLRLVQASARFALRMRVVVWNMACGGPGGSQARYERAWSYLRDELPFDVALVQEAPQPPGWAKAHWSSVVWSPKYATARIRRPLWGCAVIGASIDLVAFEVGSVFPWLSELVGSTAIATAGADPRWLASVHLRAAAIPADVVERHSIDGIEIATRDRSVWETHVIPHELHRLFGGDTFMWGGDFNADPRMDDRPGFAGGNRSMFKAYELAGSRDTRARFHPDYVQTYFKPRTNAYQLDHVFADAATERRVCGWRIDRSAATSREPYSDHAPIVVDLENI